MRHPTVMANREDELIERIRRRLPSSYSACLVLGIGDDAAILKSPRKGWDWAISSDQFLESIHFRYDIHPPDAIGYKALARATSDLAAMGSRPRLFLVSLAIPAERTGQWLDKVLLGMGRAARRFGMYVAGGDSARCSLKRGASFDITVLGEVEKGYAVTRRGARPGDALFVSGRLGAAELGLQLALSRQGRRHGRQLLRAHLYPEPALDLGAFLSRTRLASAMMDLSDGLSTDLDRLCRASQAGALVHEKDLPLVRVPQDLQKAGFNPLKLALNGGEDYGLLFTVRPRSSGRVPTKYRGTPIQQIGEITADRRLTLVSREGATRPLTQGGWDHFK